MNTPGVGTVATVSTRCSGQVQAKRREVAEAAHLDRAEPAHTPAVDPGLHRHRHGRRAGSAAAATWPCAGVVVAQRSPGRCPTTSRRPGTAVTSTRQVTVSPSRATSVLSRLRTAGTAVGRVATAHTTSATSGTPITARSPRPPKDAAVRRTTPIAVARPSARVGRQGDAHDGRTPVRGVGTVRSRSATMLRAETSLIHSSGRTTTRCSSTAGAMALTSSGVT